MKMTKWTILIDGEFFTATRHPESIIDDLELSMDFSDETWNKESDEIYLTTESTDSDE